LRKKLDLKSWRKEIVLDLIIGGLNDWNMLVFIWIYHCGGMRVHEFGGIFFNEIYQKILFYFLISAG
jgi:hypothetical protein